MNDPGAVRTARWPDLTVSGSAPVGPDRGTAPADRPSRATPQTWPSVAPAISAGGGSISCVATITTCDTPSTIMPTVYCPSSATTTRLRRVCPRRDAEVLAQVHHRDHLATQVDDALQEGRAIRHPRDRWDPDDLANPPDGHAVRLVADVQDHHLLPVTLLWLVARGASTRSHRAAGLEPMMVARPIGLPTARRRPPGSRLLRSR